MHTILSIRDELEAPYRECVLDGRKEKVGNFRIEPPGLFRGRGEHPKKGCLKVYTSSTIYYHLDSFDHSSSVLNQKILFSTLELVLRFLNLMPQASHFSIGTEGPQPNMTGTLCRRLAQSGTRPDGDMACQLEGKY